VSGRGAAVLGVTSGCVCFAGVGAWLFPTYFERLPETYASLPRNNADEIRANIEFCEDGLRRLSEKGRRSRYLSGAVPGWLVCGSSVYLADPSKNSTVFWYRPDGSGRYSRFLLSIRLNKVQGVQDLE